VGALRLTVGAAATVQLVEARLQVGQPQRGALLVLLRRLALALFGFARGCRSFFGSLRRADVALRGGALASEAGTRVAEFLGAARQKGVLALRFALRAG
jgi:hypothetical protein